MRYAELTDLDDTVYDSVFTDDELNHMLDVASRFVGRLVYAARYTRTETGHPADPDIRKAFQKAVTTQVQYWADNGINPSSGRSGVVAAAARAYPTEQKQDISFGSVKITNTPGAKSDADAFIDEALTSLRTLLPQARLCLPDAVQQPYIRVTGW